LQCHVFPFKKLLLNVRLSVNVIFDDVRCDAISTWRYCSVGL